MYLALCASCGRNENLAAASFPVVFKFTIINSSLEGVKHLKLNVPFVVVSSPIISAFHKSVRGSDPDAALYWYCRILAGGGDPLYVARRLLAIASEDIGNADPRALTLALNAWDTFERVGPAEGERAIAQAAVYLALAPKSNAVYSAFNQLKQLVAEQPAYDVPLHLRNAPTRLMKQLGFGEGYRYAHDEPGAYAAGEQYLPDGLAGQSFYQPSDRGMEKQLSEKLRYLKQLDEQSPNKRRN